MYKLVCLPASRREDIIDNIDVQWVIVRDKIIAFGPASELPSTHTNGRGTSINPFDEITVSYDAKSDVFSLYFSYHDILETQNFYQLAGALKALDRFLELLREGDLL